jgi:hypothetical protein
MTSSSSRAKASGLIAAGLLAGAAANTACAHEHWLDVSDFRPGRNQAVTVAICSGHYFPNSSFALKDKVLQGVELLPPDGSATSVDTTVAKKQRTGSIALESAGVHVLRFSLKRPRARGPAYEAKTILIAGDNTDSVARYAVGHGLELVPLRALAGLTPGDELPLSLLLDGRRVSGSLEATVEGGKSSFLKTEPDRPALLRLPKAGRYLVTANVNGRGCSLVFWIPEARKESP